jgi:hypothetical protein
MDILDSTYYREHASDPASPLAGARTVAVMP